MIGSLRCVVAVERSRSFAQVAQLTVSLVTGAGPVRPMNRPACVKDGLQGTEKQVRFHRHPMKISQNGSVISKRKLSRLAPQFLPLNPKESTM